MSAPTLLLRNGSNLDATSYVTGSITPVSGEPILLIVQTSIASGTPAAPSSITGTNGLAVTWTLVGSAAGAFSTKGLSWWFGVPSSAVAGTLTIDFGAVTQQGCLWDVTSWPGRSTSALVTQGVVSVSATSGTAIAVTGMAAFASGSAAYLWCAQPDAGSETYTPESVAGGGNVDWTLLGSTYGHASGAGNGCGMYYDGQDATPTATSAASRAWQAIGFEIAPASGGATAVSLPVASVQADAGGSLGVSQDLALVSISALAQELGIALGLPIVQMQAIARTLSVSGGVVVADDASVFRNGRFPVRRNG